MYRLKQIRCPGPGNEGSFHPMLRGQDAVVHRKHSGQTNRELFPRVPEVVGVGRRTAGVHLTRSISSSSIDGLYHMSGVAESCAVNGALSVSLHYWY